MEKVIKSYKGFNKDMTCRGFQYEEGKEYEEETADACHSGFHACEYPLDCLGYYSPNESVYHEVEQNGEFDRGEDDSKVASTKIKIGARLDISGLVKAAIDFTMSRVKKKLKVMKTTVHPLPQVTAVHPLPQVTKVHPLPTIPRALRLHGDTKGKQWVSLVPISFLLNGNILAVKRMTDTTEQSRKHGSLSVRRCSG